MPRIITPTEKYNAISMMTAKDNDGNFLFGQREIERETHLCRPYLRKLADEIGHQFPRNGIEIKGLLCICSNCEDFFRKSPSRATRAKNQFCCEGCKYNFLRGVNHPNWKDGKTTNSFSTWIKNQTGYKEWCERALQRAGYKCEISGRTDDLQVHHIKMKSISPENALDDENALVLNREIHIKIHKMMRDGVAFEECIEILKKEYNG